jgi:hypothetical protein
MNLTHNQKEIRRLLKKSRQKEQRYNETNDENYLRQRDQFIDQANKLKMNMEKDNLTKKNKVKEAEKTVDQLLNEANRQNRKERNQAEKKMKIQMEKEANLKKLRMDAIVHMKQNVSDVNLKNDVKKEKYLEDLKNVKETFKEEFKKNHPQEKSEKVVSTLRAKKQTKKHKPVKKNISEDSLIQKEFVRYRNKQVEFLEWKLTMVNFFKSIGMDEKEAEEELEKMVDNYKKQMDGTIKDPIPEEEENTIWCENESCLESLQTFDTKEDLQEHTHSEHASL